MHFKSNKLFYPPSLAAILIDVLILIISAFIVLLLTPFTTENPAQKYFDLHIFYICIWIVFSYLFQRYTYKQTEKYVHDVYKLIWTIFSVLLIIALSFIGPYSSNYSIWVIVEYSLINLLLFSIYYIIDFAISTAVTYNEYLEVKKMETTDQLPGTELLDKDAYQVIVDSIVEYCGEKAFQFLSRHVHFNLKHIYVSFSSNYFEIKSQPKKQFSAVSVFNSLNQIRGINKMFSVVNLKLPTNGLFVCRFEQKSHRKKRILEKYPPGLNHLIYFMDYIFKRVIPKMFIMNKIYFNITQGRNRVLSKTEVLGRLVYCGFDIFDVKRFGKYTYVIARKVKTLEEIHESVRYGPLLTLKRIGKNNQVINVYKFRTMFPYAEYLQAYIYRTSNLQKGGKFNKDIRINSLGKFMRKFWIDELPMLINVIRGEMKFVGVRPLSTHYFNLYSQELQKKRTRFKPGLLPPFYADLPETLSEIQESELRYLQLCETKGVFNTDLKYFFKIAHNIIFKKATSA